MGVPDDHDLKAGDLTLYGYLWAWQSSRGRLAGEKLRPAFVMHVNDEGRALLCGITTGFVRRPAVFVPIPKVECARGGLHNRVSSKLVISECNVDHVKTGCCAPTRIAGRFSPEFTNYLRERFIKVLSKKQCMPVERETYPVAHSPEMKEMSI